MTGFKEIWRTMLPSGTAGSSDQPHEQWFSLALSAAFLAALVVIGRHNYLLFHSLAEIISVVISLGIFVVAWSARRILQNGYLLFLGIAFLFIGLLDVFHLLTYKGMGVFPLSGANTPTQLWIAARYMQGFSLVAAALLMHRRMRMGFLFLVYLAALTAVLLSIFHWENFPVCYIEGQGLTAFKKISEYIISLMFAGAMALLLRMRGEFDPDVVRLLVLSIVAMIATELLFTFYVGVYDLSNMLGHLLKLFSFYFLYLAIIGVAVVRPQHILYRKLAKSEDALREERNLLKNYLDIAGVIIVVLNADQTVGLINKKGEAVLGYPREALLGKNWFDIVVPPDERDARKALFARAFTHGMTPDMERFENELITRTGEKVLIAWSHTVLADAQGNALATLSSGEDVTERRRIEKDRELLIDDLRSALNQVKTLSGLLPICASCKKIRDDQGYWSKVETYVEKYTNAQFTHGICPDCARRLYPDIFKDDTP